MQPLLISHLVTVPSGVRDHRWLHMPRICFWCKLVCITTVVCLERLGCASFPIEDVPHRWLGCTCFFPRRFYTFHLIVAACAFRLLYCDLQLPMALGVTLDGGEGSRQGVRWPMNWRPVGGLRPVCSELWYAVRIATSAIVTG